MKKYIIALFAAATVATSCYHEDALHSDPGIEKYTITDSDDPLDHARYQILTNTGVYVLYDYDQTDYRWNVQNLSGNELTMQTDRDVLTDAVLNYLDKVLFSCYDVNFQKTYFPIKILLASQIDNSGYVTESSKDLIASYGRSYLAIGRLRAENMSRDAATLTEAKGVINGLLWGNIMYQNGLIALPDSFFEPCEEYYGQRYTDDIKALGMWRTDPSNITENMCPTAANDVRDFVEMITSHTREEMELLMDGYDILYTKYTLLINHVKTYYGIDLQAIGEAKPTPVTDTEPDFDTNSTNP